MKTTGLLFIAASLTCSTFAAIEAGPFTNSANGHIYFLLTPDTWTNSQAQAVALGGNLVTISDAAENQWVVDRFSNYGGIARPLWIGLTDRDNEGNFQWVSGEPFNFSNWNLASGEPNNSGGSGYEEDFAYIIQENSGNPTVIATFWNDVPNDGFGVIPPMQGVVEIQGVPAPVPVVRGRELCWSTLDGVAYQAQWKAETSRGAWVNYGPVVTGNGEEVCISAAPPIREDRLYRVVVLE